MVQRFNGYRLKLGTSILHHTTNHQSSAITLSPVHANHHVALGHPRLRSFEPDFNLILQVQHLSKVQSGCQRGCVRPIQLPGFKIFTAQTNIPKIINQVKQNPVNKKSKWPFGHGGLNLSGFSWCWKTLLHDNHGSGCCRPEHIQQLASFPVRKLQPVIKEQEHPKQTRNIQNLLATKKCGVLSFINISRCCPSTHIWTCNLG